MSYHWTTEPTPDAGMAAEVDAVTAQRFDTQQLAEQWLTASFEDLADLGVRQVSLFEEDRLVYGPMSLEA